jgi:YegS/Rv2252/BmrU family lipid kinase
MSANGSTILVVNPVAGHGMGLKCFHRLESRLRSSFPGLDVRMSEFAGHAVEIGRRAAEERASRLICLGGDGTAFEVANGLWSEGRPAALPEIGLIPAGTGNSFVRDFGIETAEEALDGILDGRRRAVDLIDFEYRRDGRPERRVALNILGVGLIADILKLTNERLKFLGASGYSLAVLLRLAKGMHNRFDVTADGRAWQIRDSALVISNSKFTGGKMKIAPDADVSDGRADLVVFRGVNRREIVAIFKRVFSGTHTSHPKVEMTTAADIAIDAAPAQRLMADGELLGETPLRLRVLPRTLTILA